MNFNLYKVKLSIPFTSRKRMSETVSIVDDFIFYLNFKESENLEDTILNNKLLENTILNNKLLENTVLNNKLLENTILNNKLLENTVEIVMLNKIKPVWLIPALPLVHNLTFNNIHQDTKTNELTFLDSYTIDKLNKEFTNHWSYDHFVWNSSSAPIMQYFYKSIMKVMNKMNR
jgi:hypothetical protein